MVTSINISHVNHRAVNTSTKVANTAQLPPYFWNIFGVKTTTLNARGMTQSEQQREEYVRNSEAWD
ncbi:hypothetical protein Pecwa_3823 [Pectobacterium parmentieri WPP163]|nr:hypothetical protein Pecwa_3823 [Pectobacterium parmentieri WPP163]